MLRMYFGNRLIAYANEKRLSYTEFLELLLEDEENNRRGNSYKKRYSKAKIPYYKTLEEFDFSFQLYGSTLDFFRTYMACQKMKGHFYRDFLLMNTRQGRKRGSST